MHLFSSFAANNSLWLIWYLVVIADAEMVQSSPVSKRVEREREGVRMVRQRPHSRLFIHGAKNN